MTRMIERWFPCAQVTANSSAGWGSGNTERNLFTWFAARPTAQAKAAVICSLLPWPSEPSEQQRLQGLVQEALTGRYAAWDELRRAINAEHPEGASVLDPFSGRGMIPLEASRLGLRATGTDYSPVATLAGHLLADFPFRDWDGEPELSFEGPEEQFLHDPRPKLLRDVEGLLDAVGRRWEAAVDDLYPAVDGGRPWGYLWAVTLPCQECGHRFPLVGSYELRKPSTRKSRDSGVPGTDIGQSFYVAGDRATGEFRVVLHDGPPERAPVLSNAVGPDGKKVRGKLAVCPHCGYAHSVKTHQQLAGAGQGADALLLVAELDKAVGKVFRLPTAEESAAADADALAAAISQEERFSPLLPAVPDEEIPPEIGALIRPQLYGATTYGDLMCARQTLATIRLARTIVEVAQDLRGQGVTEDYVRALSGYVVAALVRKLRRSTRGATLAPSRSGVDHIFANQGTISFSYDFFETGIGEGPGTWDSLSGSTVTTLRSLLEGLRGSPAEIAVASAVSIPMNDSTVSAVVTDPPYDALIYYSDSSDFFYAWIKRALASTFPELTVSSDVRGLQAKAEEIIVWGHRSGPAEHRDRAHYDKMIARAFAEMRRVVDRDGVVTIVFGHGDPEVWQRLLGAIGQAGLVMTASWPANTEAGGAHGGMANIETTLTMACRPAPSGRGSGRKGAVETLIKEEIKRRYPDWERWGLAPADMLMAAAGPAMEVVGRYDEVLDSRGEAVDIHTFLPLARAAVQEAMAVEIDHRPLETFDARTRFALWWARLYGRQPQPKSELRWQALASSMELDKVRDLVEGDKAVALVRSSNFSGKLGPDSAVIDVALCLAAASEQGMDSMAEVLAASGLAADDQFLWAAIQFLADRLPDADPDAIAFHRVLRTKAGIGAAAENVVEAVRLQREREDTEDRQIKLL